MTKLFSKPGCPGCNASERQLKKQGTDYDKVDITQDPEAYEFVQSLGYQGVPVVYVDNETHWYGYKPEKLKTLIL